MSLDLEGQSPRRRGRGAATAKIHEPRDPRGRAFVIFERKREGDDARDSADNKSDKHRSEKR